MGDILTHNSIHGIKRNEKKILTWDCALKMWYQNGNVHMEQFIHHPKTPLIDSPLGLET
jgi:hypothetical protein